MDANKPPNPTVRYENNASILVAQVKSQLVDNIYVLFKIRCDKLPFP